MAAICACLWAGLGLAGQPTSRLEALDQIVQKASSLDDFLTNTQIQDEYFQALAKYFGEGRFTRASFDKILEQLKDLVVKVPAVRERVWAPRDPGEPLVIETLEAAEGVTLNSEEWRKFRTDWTEQLKQTSSPILSLSTDEERHTEVNRLLGLLGDRIDSFTKEIKSSELSKRAQEERTREFYLALRDDPSFKKATSYLVLENIRQGRIAEHLSSEEPSLVLYGLELLQKLEAPAGIKIPESMRSLIKFASPSPESIFSHSKERSGRALKPQKWIFRESPRLLHTIWVGIPFKSCVGGSCEYLEETTARRWAVSLLNGAHCQFLERNDRFLGNTQSIPVTRLGSQYATLEVFAPDMQRVVLILEQGKPAPTPMSLFSAWYRDAVARLPKESMGFVIGNSEAFKNGLGYSSIYKSPAYLQGKYLGLTEDLKPIDRAFEQRVVNASTDGELAKAYGGTDRMIFEARDLDAKLLTLLGSANGSDEALRSAKEARAILNGPMDAQVRLFAALAHQNLTPEMLAALKEKKDFILSALNHSTSPQHHTAELFITEANKSALSTFLRIDLQEPLTLEDFRKLGAEAAKIESYQKDKEPISFAVELIFNEKWPRFLQTNPSFEEILQARAYLGGANSINTDYAFTKAALERISKPADFTESLAIDIARPSPQYLKKYNQVLLESIPLFEKINPTTDDISDFLKKRGNYLDLDSRKTLVDMGIKKTKSASQFVQLISFSEKPRLSEEETALRDQLIRENTEAFLKLPAFNSSHASTARPTVDQINEVRHFASTVETNISLAKKALSLIDTGDEYTQLMLSLESVPAMDQVFLESFQYLKKLNVTLSQLIQVRRVASNSVSTTLQAMEISLPLVRSVDDFFEAIDLKNYKLSPEMLNARNELIRKHIDQFRSLSPDLKQRQTLNAIAPGILQSDELGLLGQYSPSCLIQKLRLKLSH